MTVLAAPAATRTRATGSTGRRRRRHDWPVIVAFLAPSAIPLILFVYVPMVRAGWISLHKWNLISPMQWVGLKNYTDLIADPTTAAVFLHTVEYVIGYLPLVLVGGLGLALALNQRLKGRNLLRGV
ncbi:MAG: hypothetical protein L6367_13490 [Cellulomonas sp.]|nr:hypothetical protein [Cellulomonas sp.]